MPRKSTKVPRPSFPRRGAGSGNKTIGRFYSIDISLFVCVTTGQIETEDSCNEYESCDDCIGKGRGCVWCPDPPVSVQHTLSIIPTEI